MSDRDLDLVVFGATSFVGQILTAHLIDRLDGEVRWAIAGRDASKLADVAATTGADVEQIVADALSADDMRSLVERTRVVASTVGPYAQYGSQLVAAAAAAGTDYCDLTGEPQWMQRMIDAHQEAAEASGARIVFTCGVDSIPSDLGVWFTQQRAIEQFGEPCASIAMRVKGFKGAASGGTVASLLGVMDEARRDPDVRRIVGNPYALAPEGMRNGPKQPNTTRPRRDDVTGQWIAPFVMAGINTKIVQRTHALLGRPWGDDFRYDEAMLTGDGPAGAARAAAMVGTLGGMALGGALPPGRWLLSKVLPEPGEGPTPEQQEAGYWDLRFHGQTASGEGIATKVTGDRDPGYGSTAKMMAEAAIALCDEPSVGGGCWTPATCFGDDLIERLVAHAGITFDVL